MNTNEAAAAQESQETGAAESATAATGNPLARKAQYRFPVGEVDSRVRALLTQEAKTAKMKGFRPGKVPLSVMQRLHGKRALQEILGQEAMKRFQEKAGQDDERIATAPELSSDIVRQDDHYEVECAWEVLPEIKSPTLTGVKIKIPTLEVGQAEVEEMIDTLREQRGKLVKHDGPPGEEGIIFFDFETRLADSDEILEQGKSRRVRLNAPDLREEFKSNLLTVKAGDTVTLDLPLPEHHPQAEIRGKAAKMKITVHAVEKIEKAEIDEDFLKAFGAEDPTALGKLVEENLRHEVAVRLRSLAQQRALNALISATPPFSLPTTMVISEVRKLRASGAHGANADTATPQDLQPLIIEAQRRVSLGLILAEWQRREQRQPSDEEVDRRLREVAAAYDNPEQVAAEIRANPQRLNLLRLSIMEDKVVAWVREQAETEEEAIPLSRLLEHTPSTQAL